MVRPPESQMESPLSPMEEMRRQLADMDLRILRQQRRIQRILTLGVGPIDDMQALLADMIETRDLIQARMDRLGHLGIQSEEAKVDPAPGE